MRRRGLDAGVMAGREGEAGGDGKSSVEEKSR